MRAQSALLALAVLSGFIISEVSAKPRITARNGTAYVDDLRLGAYTRVKALNRNTDRIVGFTGTQKPEDMNDFHIVEHSVNRSQVTSHCFNVAGNRRLIEVESPALISWECQKDSKVAYGPFKDHTEGFWLADLEDEDYPGLTFLTQPQSLDANFGCIFTDQTGNVTSLYVHRCDNPSAPKDGGERSFWVVPLDTRGGTSVMFYHPETNKCITTPNELGKAYILESCEEGARDQVFHICSSTENATDCARFEPPSIDYDLLPTGNTVEDAVSR